MISNYRQATAVQVRRKAAGKIGHAKAVRRYLQRQEAYGESYEVLKAQLACLPIATKKTNGEEGSTTEREDAEAG